MFLFLNSSANVLAAGPSEGRDHQVGAGTELLEEDGLGGVPWLAVASFKLGFTVVAFS